MYRTLYGNMHHIIAIHQCATILRTRNLVHEMIGKISEFMSNRICMEHSLRPHASHHCSSNLQKLQGAIPRLHLFITVEIRQSNHRMKNHRETSISISDEGFSIQPIKFCKNSFHTNFYVPYFRSYFLPYLNIFFAEEVFSSFCKYTPK